MDFIQVFFLHFWSNLGQADTRAQTPDIIKEHLMADNCSVISEKSSSNCSSSAARDDDPDIELPSTIGQVCDNVNECTD